ncbi:MAG: hypothetical protein U0525_04855 [Patescibacteria group bacterium]
MISSKNSISETQQRELSQKSGKRRLAKLPQLIGLFVLIATTSSLFIYALRINKIEVNGSPKNVLGLEMILGKYKIFFDNSEIQKIIENNNPSLKVSKIDFKAPGNLQIYAEYMPDVAFFTKNSRVFIVNSISRITRIQDEIPKDLGELKIPTNYLTQNLKVGESFDSTEVKFISKIASILKKNSISAFRIYLLDSELVVCELPTTNTTIKLSVMRNRDETYSRLNDFLSKLYTSGKSIRNLDLRFEKAIIEEG